MSEFVERPARRRSRSRLPLDDLIATATNGQAVRVPLNERSRTSICWMSASAAKYRGYRSLARSDGDHEILWWEKL